MKCCSKWPNLWRYYTWNTNWRTTPCHLQIYSILGGWLFEGLLLIFRCLTASSRSQYKCVSGLYVCCILIICLLTVDISLRILSCHNHLISHSLILIFMAILRVQSLCSCSTRILMATARHNPWCGKECWRVLKICYVRAEYGMKLQSDGTCAESPTDTWSTYEQKLECWALPWSNSFSRLRCY